mgnify:CR=1 FL=1
MTHPARPLDTPMITGAVVVAAGSGQRFGAALPKQFHALGNRPVVAWALEAMLECPLVQVVQPVMMPELFEEHLSPWVASLPPQWRARLLPPVGGGDTRWMSVLRGVQALPAEVRVVAVHDGARPFPPAAPTARAIELVKLHPARRGAMLAAPSTDSLKRVAPPDASAPNAPLRVVASENRETIWRAQTPQVFGRAELEAALQAAIASGAQPGDEVEAMQAVGGCEILMVPSTSENLKVTHPHDLEMARLIATRLGGGARRTDETP